MKIDRRIQRLWLLSSIAVLLLSWVAVAAACDDESAEEQVCDDLDQLASAIKSIQDVSSDSAREDLQQVRADVQGAVADIEGSAAQVPEIQELQDAIESLRASVEALPEEITAGEAIRALGTEIVSLSAALSNAREAFEC